MASTSIPFIEVAPGLAIGAPIPAGWQSLTQARLIILVGVTGVGKTTTLQHWQQIQTDFTLLPDRRDLADQLIISTMQALDGAPVQPVTDRKQRFAYTRRYREQFPGGMSHALSQLWFDPQRLGSLLVFDGLRGVDEVSHALQALPQARFVVLDAPDLVRVQRLLGRNDAFDKIAVSTPPPQTHSPHPNLGARVRVQTLAEIGVADADALFSPQEAAVLLELTAKPVEEGGVSVDDLRAKLQIVVEERRNYDPVAAQAVLQKLAPERTLAIDTTLQPPAVVAQTIVGWLA